MCRYPSIPQSFLDPPWPSGVGRSIQTGKDGLVLGAGTCLARMTTHQRLDLDRDRERVLALLSVVRGRPVAADVLGPIAAAAAHWRRGDKALANLRLILAVLPRLDDPTDADRAVSA